MRELREMNKYQKEYYKKNQKEYLSLDSKYAVENDYKIWDWIFEAVGNFTNFKGRARRKEFWYFYLANTIVMIIIGKGLITFTAEWSMLIIIAITIPMLAVTARRLHDIGRSGLMMCIAVVPLIGGLFLLYLLSKNTSTQDNEWGPPAKQMH